MKKENHKIIAQVSCFVLFCYVVVGSSYLLGGGLDSITGYSVSEGGVPFVDSADLINNITNNTNSSVVGLIHTDNSITGFSVSPVEPISLGSLNTILFVVFGIIMVVSIILNFSVFHWKNTLEKEVDSKKSELNNSNQEIKDAKQKLNLEIEQLENFIKLAVGRELKMVELKEKIALLEEKLKK